MKKIRQRGAFGRQRAQSATRRVSRRRATFEALENRSLLSTVNFNTASETITASGSEFSIPVTLLGGTPTIFPFATGINEPGGKTGL